MGKTVEQMSSKGPRIITIISGNFLVGEYLEGHIDDFYGSGGHQTMHH